MATTSSSSILVYSLVGLVGVLGHFRDAPYSPRPLSFHPLARPPPPLWSPSMTAEPADPFPKPLFTAPPLSPEPPYRPLFTLPKDSPTKATASSTQTPDSPRDEPAFKAPTEERRREMDEQQWGPVIALKEAQERAWKRAVDEEAMQAEKRRRFYEPVPYSKGRLFRYTKEPTDPYANAQPPVSPLASFLASLSPNFPFHHFAYLFHREDITTPGQLLEIAHTDWTTWEHLFGRILYCDDCDGNPGKECEPYGCTGLPWIWCKRLESIVRSKAEELYGTKCASRTTAT